MARYIGPVCRLCRNENQKLFLKGNRCNSPKCAVSKRPYGAGQHGQSRKKLSEYAIHLKEKQKVRRTYLVLEKQFARYFNEAERKKGVTGTILLQLLESRFDNILFQAGFSAGRKQARQLIRHRHFVINGRVVDIPSYRLKAGDEIAVRANSVKLLKEIIEDTAASAEPKWMSIDKSGLKIKVDSLPERADLDPNIKEQLIIEYYSK
ncbi:MAG: 30S ribosomal protein S4 [Candidatus Gastranaerophilales bacterium]|nr:30S ribosomal protein S4 [Candidatus Gastranaerophilales bacterium]